MKNIRSFTGVAVIACTILTMAARADSTLTVTAQMRSGVNEKLTVTILDNPVHSSGATVLCVPGLAHTGNTFRPLATQIFADPVLGSHVSRLVLLNLPDRGGSGLPFGRNDHPLFGNLGVSDYAACIISTLEQCAEQGVPIQQILAHSMGGIVAQVAQEQLLAQASSLASAYGVTNVVLIASTQPAGVPNPVFDSGYALALLSTFKSDSSTLGPIVETNPYVFLALFFGGVPGSPSPDDVINLGYLSAESFTASSDAVGPVRPAVRAGAFATAHGSTLRVIAEGLDGFNPVPVEQGMYEFLTGDMNDSGFAVSADPTAVHDQYIANPAALVPVLGL